MMKGEGTRGGEQDLGGIITIFQPHQPFFLVISYG